MGVWGDLFQASVRLASTVNFRGVPSSGIAFRDVTWIGDAAADLRRNGSNSTASPLSKGTMPTIAPMTPAKSPLRKPRRSRCGGDVDSLVEFSTTVLLTHDDPTCFKT